MMNFQVTVRYGARQQRYHTFTVHADAAKAAHKSAANQLPLDIAPDVDLVELRIAVDPDARSYVDEELV